MGIQFLIVRKRIIGLINSQVHHIAHLSVFPAIDLFMYILPANKIKLLRIFGVI